MDRKITHVRLSRRRALTLVGMGAAGLGAAALVGCSARSTERPAAESRGGGAAQPDAAASAKPQRGGTLKWAETKSPDTLDPYRSGGGLPTNGALVYSRLFDFQHGDGVLSTGKIVGNLVEKWEQPDPQTLLLHLNKAAKFDQKDPLNGRAVNSEDVVQSWNRLAKEDTYRANFANAINPDSPILGMEAIDASTVRVKTAFPDVTTLGRLVGGVLVQPVEGIAKKFDLSKEPRGSGPFIFENYTPAVSFAYRRNPDWFLGKGELPRVERLQIGIIPDQGQLDVQFRAKNLHLKAVSETNIVPFAKELPGAEIAVGNPQGSSRTIVFSYSPGQPWHDVRLRRAVSMAIDRDLMGEVLFDPKKFETLGVKLNVRWNAPLAAGYGDYYLDPKSSQFGPGGAYMQHNVAEAVKLLAAAGYSSAKPFEFDNVYPGLQWGTNWPQRVEILQSMVQKAGMKMNASSVDYVTDYTPNYMRAKAKFKGKIAPAAVHFMPGGGWNPDPLMFYGAFYNSLGASSMVGDKFPELDVMLRKERATTNFEEHVAGIHTINRWMVENMVTWPVGAETEDADLVWKALRGPQQYRMPGGGGRSPDLAVLPHYWFREPI